MLDLTESVCGWPLIDAIRYVRYDSNIEYREAVFEPSRKNGQRWDLFGTANIYMLHKIYDNLNQLVFNRLSKS